MWQINTTKHYKIWFSKNSDEFLDEENQVRFIEACRNNPHITFSFIYSSSCLTAQAQQSLQDFCNQYKIKPVDFDMAILSLIKEEDDKDIYQLALKEIKEKGGNLAAASDCARLIVPIIEQWGIYSDFDVELLFSNLPTTMRVNAPVVCPVEFIREATIDSPCINNELLMVAFDPANPQHIHPQGLEKIRRLQAAVKARYADPKKAFSTHLISGLSLEFATDTAFFIQQFFAENPKATIFEFRQFILQLDLTEYARLSLARINNKTIIMDEKDKPDWLSSYKKVLEANALEHLLWRAQYDPDLNLSTEAILAKKLALLKHNLYVYSVMYISGPINYYDLCDKIPQSGFEIQGNQVCATISPAADWQLLLKEFKCIATNANGFKGKVISKNTLVNQHRQNDQDPLALLPPRSDQSWTPLGEALRQKRIRKDANPADKTSPASTKHRKTIPGQI